MLEASIDVKRKGARLVNMDESGLSLTSGRRIPATAAIAYRL